MKYEATHVKAAMYASGLDIGPITVNAGGKGRRLEGEEAEQFKDKLAVAGQSILERAELVSVPFDDEEDDYSDKDSPLVAEGGELAALAYAFDYESDDEKPRYCYYLRAYRKPKPVNYDDRWEVRLPSTLKEWALTSGGSELVRSLLEAERKRRETNGLSSC